MTSSNVNLEGIDANDINGMYETRGDDTVNQNEDSRMREDTHSIHV